MMSCGPTRQISQSHQANRGAIHEERRILGTNNLERSSVVRGSPAYALGLSIGRLEDTIDGYGYCTSTRVSERLFLTNQHCLRTCTNMRFRLGFEDDRTLSQHAVFRCRKLLTASEALDYALILVEPESESKLRDYPAAALSQTAPRDSMPIVLPSQPLTDETMGLFRYKEFDRSRDCHLGMADVFASGSGRLSVTHYCDTDLGSSGATLFDPESGLAVGLHWGGYDGSHNLAIPMNLIIEDLRARADPPVFDSLTIGELRETLHD